MELILKLNQDCVRDVMLFVENKLEFGVFLHLEDFLKAPTLKKYDADTITYALGKLDETDFLHSDATWNNNNLVYFSTGMLTWNGHKFLDTIRDNRVWATTKKVTSKFSSVSVSIMENIASQVITNLIKNEMTKIGH